MRNFAIKRFSDRLRLPPLLLPRSLHQIEGHRHNRPLARQGLRARLRDRAFVRHLRLRLLDPLAGLQFRLLS